jgi:NAD(P)H-dependent FMN reductase
MTTYNVGYLIGSLATQSINRKLSDAILFVTPEYNRSLPGGLKNAIDWASRPYGSNAFTRKPSAVIGASRWNRPRASCATT